MSGRPAPGFTRIPRGVWSAMLALYGTFTQLITYVVFIGWIFYALAAASIFGYRKRYPEESTRTYSTPGYPATPIVFILAAAALVLNTVWSSLQSRDDAKKMAIGISIVLIGIPIYFIWRLRLQRIEKKLAAAQLRGD